MLSGACWKLQTFMEMLSMICCLFKWLINNWMTWTDDEKSHQLKVFLKHIIYYCLLQIESPLAQKMFSRALRSKCYNVLFKYCDPKPLCPLTSRTANDVMRIWIRLAQDGLSTMLRQSEMVYSLHQIPTGPWRCDTLLSGRPLRFG